MESYKNNQQQKQDSVLNDALEIYTKQVKENGYEIIILQNKDDIEKQFPLGSKERDQMISLHEHVAPGVSNKNAKGEYFIQRRPDSQYAVCLRDKNTGNIIGVTTGTANIKDGKPFNYNVLNVIIDKAHQGKGLAKLIIKLAALNALKNGSSYVTGVTNFKFTEFVQALQAKCKHEAQQGIDLHKDIQEACKHILKENTDNVINAAQGIKDEDIDKTIKEKYGAVVGREVQATLNFAKQNNMSNDVVHEFTKDIDKAIDKKYKNILNHHTQGIINSALKIKDEDIDKTIKEKYGAVIGREVQETLNFAKQNNMSNDVIDEIFTKEPSNAMKLHISVSEELKKAGIDVHKYNAIGGDQNKNYNTYTEISKKNIEGYFAAIEDSKKEVEGGIQM